MSGDFPLIELYIILIGLVVASFFGSLSFRLPRKLSMLRPPSYCPACEKRLKIYELIPFFSYLLLGGKCRNCKSPIPIQYFVVEILTPLFYFILYLRYGITPLFFGYIYLISVLLYLSLVDIDTGSVSLFDIVLVYGGGILMVFLSSQGLTGHRVSDSLYGFALSLALLIISVLILYLMKRRNVIGMGDLLLIPAAALYVSLEGIIRILIFSSVTGLLFGLGLVFSGRDMREYRFPMIPFVTAGVCVEIFVFYSRIVI
jgi:leader peptidase (prepilin peptidase)/N-methyltransferase